MSNGRHELFAQNLVKGETIDAAYAHAGFKAHSGNAARLSGNESVRRRVEELQAEVAKVVVVTAADIAKMLIEDREFAVEMESPSAAVSASMGLAKIYGYDRVKLELTGKDGGPIQTEDRTVSHLIEEAKRLGIDPSAIGLE